MNAPISHRELKLVAVGDETGVVLPAEMLERLGVAQGDCVALHDDGDSLRLTAENARARKTRLADEIMREDHEILSVLAR